MNTKLIFNSFLAKQLIKRGHKIIDLRKDYKKENTVIYVFEETEDFIKDLKELTLKERTP